MGCDIHIYVEYLKKVKGKEVWIDGDIYEWNEWGRSFDKIEIYNGRSYKLFSILANVRNRDDINYISIPKGLPNNCHNNTLKEYEDWISDAHSISYLTLKELKVSRDKFKKIKYSGMVNEENRIKIKNGEMPNEWCQGTNAIGYEYVEWEYETDLLSLIINPLQERLYQVFNIYEWEKDNYDEKLDDNIRVVFWFDN